MLLFRDELSTRKLSRDWYHEVWDEDEDEDEEEEEEEEEDEDEDEEEEEDEDEEMFSIPLYSSGSGISKAWLTQYDPGLVTPRKAITNRN